MHSTNRNSWKEILTKADAIQIWDELCRIVRSHFLISRILELLTEDWILKIVQELFVTLLIKGKFEYYLNSKMDDSEIEAEINQELRKILVIELKKLFPESYKLCRRTANLVKTSKFFKEFDDNTSKVLGLAEWTDEKKFCNYQELQQKLRSYKERETFDGFVDSAIRDADLEKLIIKILKTIDSTLAFDDICLLLMLHSFDLAEALKIVGLKKAKKSGKVTNIEEIIAQQQVERFLNDLKESTNRKTKEYSKILKVLWHCYLSIEKHPQNLRELKISEAAISDYCGKIEKIIHKFSSANKIEAAVFKQKLKAELQQVMQFQSRQKYKKSLKCVLRFSGLD
jgi:hypothetical protein